MVLAYNLVDLPEHIGGHRDDVATAREISQQCELVALHRRMGQSIRYRLANDPHRGARTSGCRQPPIAPLVFRFGFGIIHGLWSAVSDPQRSDALSMRSTPLDMPCEAARYFRRFHRQSYRGYCSSYAPTTVQSPCQHPNQALQPMTDQRGRWADLEFWGGQSWLSLSFGERLCPTFQTLRTR